MMRDAWPNEPQERKWIARSLAEWKATNVVNGAVPERVTARVLEQERLSAPAWSEAAQPVA